MRDKKTSNDSKSVNRIKYIVYILAVIALCSVIVSVVSKYVHTNKEQSAVSAFEFYFESDLLTEEGKEYNISPDTETISFEIKNYPDELRFASEDIAYTVIVKEDGVQVLEKTGTLDGKKQSSKTIDFPVTDGKTYTVSATGSKGFSKTLTATFVVAPTDNKIYKSVENTEHYVLLTVWTEEISGNVEITFPDGLVPDNTDDILKNVKTADGGFTDSVNFKKTYSSYSYRFFKTNSDNYDENDFNVTFADVAAVAEILAE